MSAERIRLRQIVSAWGDKALVEIWDDNTVWISRADGTHRTPLREWVENDPRLDAEVTT